MIDPEATQKPDLVLLYDRRELGPEALQGSDLAALLREVWHGRGLEWESWESATLPSGRPVTPELHATLCRLLAAAKLARRKPVKGALWELQASHREALARLASLL